MADMSQFTGKKEFPSQALNRLVWIIETIRENQGVAAEIIRAASESQWDTCRLMLDSLYGTERDAMLNLQGVLTPEQIAAIKGLEAT